MSNTEKRQSRDQGRRWLCDDLLPVVVDSPDVPLPRAASEVLVSAAAKRLQTASASLSLHVHGGPCHARLALDTLCKHVLFRGRFLA